MRVVSAESGAPRWQRWLAPGVVGRRPYSTSGASVPTVARLHANECPFPWPTEVMDAVAEAVRAVPLHRYPSISGEALRRVIAERAGVSADRVVLGNGSDEIITLLTMALSGEGARVVVPDPSFVMYGARAETLGVAVERVPLDSEFELDVPAMDRALTAGAALCFLPRPNNPTGTVWPRDVVLGLIERHPETVFVVDEAYTAYAGGDSMVDAVTDKPNAVWMATLSKVGGAALRLGWAVAPRGLADALNVVRNPYNVSGTTLAAAEVLMTRFAGAQGELVRAVVEGRERLAGILAAAGLHCYPSGANLVLARVGSPSEAATLAQGLRARGVLVKSFAAPSRLAGCVRVTVGRPEELDALAAALAPAG